MVYIDRILRQKFIALQLLAVHNVKENALDISHAYHHRSNGPRFLLLDMVTDQHVLNSLLRDNVADVVILSIETSSILFSPL